MAYIVQPDVPARDVAASISLGDRQAALAVALQWLNEGYTGIKIIGDARIYTPEELAMIVRQEPRPCRI
jgi:hypothetical protein